MSMAYIRDYYRVPAGRYGRITYTGDPEARVGTIVGAIGSRLRVRFDDDPGHVQSLHPTYEIQYMHQKLLSVVQGMRVAEPAKFAAALEGREPADSLRTRDRRLLIVRLHADGLTDAAIAALTMLTTYTVARIRDELALDANLVEVA